MKKAGKSKFEIKLFRTKRCGVVVVVGGGVGGGGVGGVGGGVVVGGGIGGGGGGGGGGDFHFEKNFKIWTKECSAENSSEKVQTLIIAKVCDRKVCAQATTVSLSSLSSFEQRSV